MEKRTKALTLKTLADQDWKTQLARKYSNIPEGVEVEVLEEDFVNFFGVWTIVRWNGNRYYVDKKDLAFNYNEGDINEDVNNYMDYFK